MKKISITITDYIWEAYLREYKGNRSQFIQNMMLKGIDAETAEEKNYKIQLIDKDNKIRELEIKLTDCERRRKIAETKWENHKHSKEAERDEMLRIRSINRGIRASGIMEDLP